MATPKSLLIPSPPEFTFTVLPPDARLEITYKNALAYAHVSSQAMSLASPVWKNFFFPPWRTGDNHIEELDFTEDNADALLILLRIAHFTSEKYLFETIPGETLVQLALLCDQYLCQDLVETWIEEWVEDEWPIDQAEFRKMHGERIEEAAYEMMLVGWVFRAELRVHYVHQAVMWLWKESKEVTLPAIPSDWPLPNGILEPIIEARDSTLKALRRIAKRHLVDLEDRKHHFCEEHKKYCTLRLIKYFNELLDSSSMRPWNSRTSLEKVNFFHCYGGKLPYETYRCEVFDQNLRLKSGFAEEKEYHIGWEKLIAKLPSLHRVGASTDTAMAVLRAEKGGRGQNYHGSSRGWDNRAACDCVLFMETWEEEHDPYFRKYDDG